MKVLIKRMFSIVGLGVYRLNPPQNNSKKVVVSTPIQFNSKQGLEEFYSDREAVESYLDPGFYELILDLLASYEVDYEQKQIADIGCGTGGLLKALRARSQVVSLTGFEYSEKALDIARSQLLDAEFYTFDIYEGINRQFDIIFCIEVLEHLLQPETALRNLVGMLADFGVAMVTVPNGRVDTFEGHINFWSPESWKVFVNQVCEPYSITTGLLRNGQNNYAVIARKGTNL